MITGTTRLVALLRHPLAESLSPRMQNAAFAARALDWAYFACDVEPDDLASAVAGLRALRFSGANVTMPHKTAVVGLCDELDDVARRSRAVNTLVFGEQGRITGANTDGPAVAQTVDATGANVLVLGRGGAARSAAVALEDAGAAGVRLVSRGDEDWPPTGDDVTILVNATPLREECPVTPRGGQQVVDLAYRPDGRPTALVEAAHAAGCRTVVDGLEILVRQGAASFELWTRIEAPVDVMRAAVARIV
jgi:shikimate dehydrogenase